MKLFWLLTISFILLGCGDSKQEQPTTSRVDANHGGEEIYLLYCAQCHGPKGDGKALIQLDRPARSFVDGGFSFGNTLHAISKTTSSGIPGTPMPPFVDVLSEDDPQ